MTEPTSDPTLVLRGRASETAPVDQTPAPPAAGPAIPGYVLLGEVGRGGMGVVFKARQTALGRVVAVKTILTAGRFDASELHERLRREAEAVARLSHPNIIGVFEVGSCATGPYLVMEFLAGGNLAKRLDGQPLPPRVAAGLVAGLARAVHAAHCQGLVHRDLKPANLLLVEGPEVPLERATLKVSDFGLVRRLDDQSETRSGQVLGTPGYMAPEQARAAAGQALGPTVDVYALGVMLYEMLCGVVPYRGSTALETVHLMLSTEPPRPSGRVCLPRDLETICLKCLSKEPARRYASAAELADELERYLAGRPIQARPTPVLERGLKWAKRQPLAAALAVSCLVLVAVSFPLVFSLWLQAEAAQKDLSAKHAEARRMAEAETDARREAQGLSARLQLEQSVQLCERGDVPAGLLWLERARRAPAAGDDFHRSARVLGAGWGQSLYRLRGFAVHDGLEVQRAAYSADGKTLATGGGRYAWAWHGDGRPLGMRLQLEGEVLTVGSHGGGLVAVAARLGEVSLYRLPGGEALRRLPIPARARVATLADGRLLLGFKDSTARLYDVDAGTLLFAAWSHAGGEAVKSVALSPDGAWAATGSDDGARVWSARDGKPVAWFREHTAPVIALAFGPGGREVLSGGKDHKAMLWRRDGTIVHRFEHEHGVCAVAFRPGGDLLATGSWDDTVRLWDRETGRPVGATIRHANDVGAVAWRPDGARLATASDDGTLRLWEVPPPSAAAHSLPHPDRVNVLAVSPDGRAVLTGCSDGLVRLWPAGGGKPRVLAGHGVNVAAAFAPDGQTVAVGSAGHTVRLLRAGDGEPEGEPLKLTATALSVAWSPDGQTLAVGCEDEAPSVFLFGRDGRPGRVLRGHTRKIPSLAFSPDGETLASASWDFTVRRWDAATGEPRGEPLRHQDLVQAVAFSPDGESLASGGDDYTVRFWEAHTGRPIGPPTRVPDKVQTLAYSPGGEVVVTGDRRGRLRLWEPNTGRPAGEVRLHAKEVRTVAFDGDGALWSGSWDGTARRWRMPDFAAERPLPWLEAHTGLTLDAGGALVPLDAAGWLRRAGVKRPHPPRPLSEAERGSPPE